MRHTEYLQTKLPYHSATYYLTLLQLFVYALAAAWLLRSVGHHGFWRTTRVAVTKTGS